MKKQESIPFPFTPYTQQRDLMEAILDCFDSSGVGVFESPTGTGKSLSVICSAMYWLRKEENSIIEDVQRLKMRNKHISSVSSSSSSRRPRDINQPDDWLEEWIEESNQNGGNGHEMEQKLEALIKYNAMLSRISRQSQIQHQRKLMTEKSIKIDHGIKDHYVMKKVQRIDKSRKDVVVSGDNSYDEHFEGEDLSSNSFALDDYDSDGNTSETLRDEDVGLGYRDVDRGGIKGLKLPKIFYCSRTHSQLSQFINEIRRTTYKDVRCITLGSRKTFCINEEINRHGMENIITEKCLELQVQYFSIIHMLQNINLCTQ